MRGVQFLSDNQGKKIAALVDLKEHSQFWTDVLEEGATPEEFQFLIDDRGEKIAVILDFEKHSEWEDVYFGLITDEIEDEPGVPWEDFKRDLKLKRQLSI